jgi:hypothetical protein
MTNIKREFSGITIGITQGNKAKKKLSNKVEVTLPQKEGEVTLSFTIRQAQILRNFLQNHLQDDLRKISHHD